MQRKTLTAQDCFLIMGLPHRKHAKTEAVQENLFSDSDISSECSLGSDKDPPYNPFVDRDDESDMSEDEDSQSNCESDGEVEAGDFGVNLFDDQDILQGQCEARIEDSCDSDLSEVYPDLSQFITPTAESSEPKIVLAQRGQAKNKWDKKHSCKFCHKTRTKMSTHLQRKHKDEFEVIQVMKMKKGSAERRAAWGKLLNQGDYEHNFSVLKSGSGTLIPKYRSEHRTAEDYVTCPFCKGMYCRKLLAHHVASCFENPGMKQKRGQSVKEGTLLMPVPQNFSSGFYRNVLQNMKDDDILRLIRNDHLLICFGERLYYRKDLEEHTSGHISGRLRELGRLLKCLRQKSEMKIATLTQALHVSHFDILVSCVREIAEFDSTCNQFRKGTLALKIGYSLKKCASILKAEAIKNEDSGLREQAESFQELVSGNWYDLVSATANQSVHRARQNKPRLLPACEDIGKLHHLLNEKCQSNDYATLAKATLCLISLFNRKRGGEVQRTKIADIESGLLCATTPSDQDILQGLSETEKKLMGYFNRIEIRGKFNRPVPVLLTSQMVTSINRLIEMRHSMVPSINSPYLFATPSGVRPYRGSDAIRELAKEAEVKDLTIFTFTHLRKQIATLSQTMEISKWQQDQLANFLGHDIRIHRQIYRQPSDVLDRAYVAKILLNVNKGINLSPVEDVLLDENEELEDDDASATAVTDDVSDSDDDEDVVSVPCGKEHRKVQESSGKMSARKGLVTCGKKQREVQESSGKMATGKGDGPRLPRKEPRQRLAWTEEEKQAVRNRLHACIVTNRVPKKHEAEYAIACEPVLKKRSWKNVKDFVYNIVKKNAA